MTVDLLTSGGPPVLVSAGHYPARPGASFGDFLEHHEAVIWRNHLVDLLGRDLARAVPVGTLRQKADWIHRHPATLAVEIHFNDAQRWVDRDGDGVQDADEWLRIGRGSETLYYPGSVLGLAAATVIQDALASVFPPDRGTKPGYYRMDPRRGPDFFLRLPGIVCLIVEPEFVRNAEAIRARQDAGVAALAEGIRNALTLLQRGG